MFKTFFTPFFVSLLSLTATAQENDKFSSAITVVPIKNDIATISGICSNNTLQTLELRYELSVQERSLSGNTSNNKQSGNFYLAPETSKTLSTTTINFEPLDDTEIVLTIFNADNTQIAQHKKLLTKADFIKN